MLRLRGGGSAPVRAGFGGGSDARGPFKNLRALVPGTPEGGPKRPPGPGSAWGLFRGHVGGVQRRPRPNSRRGGDISPPGRTDGRDARTRLRRLMGAPRARGRPARALPHGPSPRPDRPPCAPAPALGHRGFGEGKPRASPLRKGEVQGLASGPQFAEAASGPRFGASLPLPLPPSLPPSPPPLEGTGAWQGPPSGRGRRAGAALPRWARETVWRGGKKGRGRGPRAGTPLFSEG